MELDRPHRPASASTSSDLFICFTSRLSHSSSMRMSSKSILSPGRSDKPPISLSTSLSRRLRNNNGSLKGGQSPMFPPGVNTKKRGCAFENPEPSSPKVTCIGQVRVKTKKQGKKMKMNMKACRARRITTTHEKNQEFQQGESKNQSWVQFPVTICDALKEFSCFVPCRSGEGNRGEKQRESSSSSSCYRWLVAFNGGGEGKTRDIELVVGEEEERREEESVVMEREFSRRRSIFDDMDFNVDEICDGGVGEEEAARVNVCVPPKNALLLMRCRSDPVKMSALVKKFWESPTKEDDVEKGEEIEVGVKEEREEKRRSSVREDEKIEAFSNSDEVVVKEEAEERISVREEEKIESFSTSHGVDEDQMQPEEGEDEEKEESFTEKQEGENGAIDTRVVDQERISVSEDGFGYLAMLFEEDPDGMEKKEAIDDGQYHVPPESTPSIEHFQEEEEEDEDLVEIQETVVGKDSIFEYTEDYNNNQQLPLERQEEEEEETRVAENQSRSEEQSPISNEEEEEEKQFEKPMNKESSMEMPVLPDCLLLMMCEPKLSMEVSTETWVCSTDFLRPWLPERHRQHQLKKLNAAGDEPKTNKKHKNKENRANPESIHPLPPAAAAQPPRSSCSFPISMASLIEKKLVSAVGYEPFVLTRCKSEPMRTVSAKLGSAQEVACFWKNNKIEPHRPATCGIGAAGVGF